MPRLIHLTDAQLRRLHEPGRHAVDSSLGLYVRIGADGVGRFQARITTADGRRVWHDLGPSLTMTLAEARLRAARVESEVSEAQSTFASALEAHVTRQRAVWRAGGKSEDQWRQSMADYVLPIIGSIPIDKIRPADVVRVLEPIRTKVETARRVRQRIASVIEGYHLMAGKVAPNPAAEALIERLLPTVRREVRHHPAPTLQELREAMKWLDDRHASHRCLRFVIMHACRSGEARGATWSEVDGDTWSVPGQRMKAGRPWRSPVMWLPFPRSDGLLFEGARGKPLSDMALLEVVRGRGLTWTPHGCRAAFRSWAATEGLNVPAAEMQLAHTPDKLTQAYQRSDLLEQRRELLTAWSGALQAE
jgi:integrase